MIEATMNAGDILRNINGLTHDKLTYFVRSGYVRPYKIKRGDLYYNEFSDADLEIIKKAWAYICTYDMKTRSAFERAKRESNSKQLELFQLNGIQFNTHPE
jgi:hypothetical protein